MVEGGAAGPRLFVACELPEELTGALGRMQADLRRTGGERLRWVRPENIHLTLKFLGDVEASRVGALTDALRGAVRPFQLRVRPNSLGSFGGRRMRVVWVGLKGDVDGLVGLAGSIDAALASIGFPADGRPFTPHLTIARVPDGLPSGERARLAELVGRFKLQPSPEAVLNEVSLIRSVLGPGGASYETLGVFP